MLDKQLRKELEEAWLCEMAYTRKKAEELCKGAANIFMVHLCKCFLFPKCQYYNHWLKECINCCMLCDNIRLKPNAKRPTPEFFKQDDCICEEIETADDAVGYLTLAIWKCPEFDKEEITNDEALRFIDFWEDLREELSDYFSDEDIFDRSTYYQIIDEAIKNNIS